MWKKIRVDRYGRQSRYRVSTSSFVTLMHSGDLSLDLFTDSGKLDPARNVLSWPFIFFQSLHIYIPHCGGSRNLLSCLVTRLANRRHPSLGPHVAYLIYSLAFPYTRRHIPKYLIGSCGRRSILARHSKKKENVLSYMSADGAPANMYFGDRCRINVVSLSIHLDWTCPFDYHFIFIRVCCQSLDRWVVCQHIVFVKMISLNFLLPVTLICFCFANKLWTST